MRHRNPFESLEVPRNDNELKRELIDKWVIPFYTTSLSNADDTTLKAFAVASREIDSGVVYQLLGEFDWRPRITGAYFAAINNYKELDDIIGRHLLKSEVTYAGGGYCLALAAFATQNSKDYLTAYLEYYLQRKDLWIDQADAFCALEHLDQAAANQLMDKWTAFVADKPNWELEKSRHYFSKELEAIVKIREVAKQP